MVKYPEFVLVLKVKRSYGLWTKNTRIDHSESLIGAYIIASLSQWKMLNHHNSVCEILGLHGKSFYFDHLTVLSLFFCLFSSTFGANLLTDGTRNNMIFMCVVIIICKN